MIGYSSVTKAWLATLWLLIIAMYGEAAFACECFGYRPSVEFQKAEFVGLVKVVSTSNSPTNFGTPYTAELKVLKAWKGDGEKIHLSTRASMCAVSVEENAKYLVFLRDDDGDKVYELNDCGPSSRYHIWPFRTPEQRVVLDYLRQKDSDAVGDN